MTKRDEYRKLVAARKACRACPTLRNPAEGDLNQFDSDQIGPWTLLRGDLNAELLVVGEDWGDTGYYLDNCGLDDPTNPTTVTLLQLLQIAGARTVFLTNAVLCLKSGEMQAKISSECFANCGARFLRSQIEIVAPTVVVGLGEKSYSQIRKTFGLVRTTFRDAVASDTGTLLPNGSILHARYHCGKKSQNMNRSLAQQREDWLGIARALQRSRETARTPTSRILSYVVTHDHGFAPNPFGGFLTLATCKPVMRRGSRVGDWIVGTGSVRGVGSNYLVYAAQVNEILPIEEYADDPRFRVKVPSSSGQEWKRHGDNIYRRGAEGWLRQRNPYHMMPRQMERDLSGRNVLICGTFWYFGQRAPPLPDDLLSLIKKGPGHKLADDPGVVRALQEFLARFPPGIARGAHSDIDVGSKGRCSTGCRETD